MLQNLIRYGLVNGTNQGVNYFYVDPETGAVRVKEDLARDPFVQRYVVCL